MSLCTIRERDLKGRLIRRIIYQHEGEIVVIEDNTIKKRLWARALRKEFNDGGIIFSQTDLDAILDFLRTGRTPEEAEGLDFTDRG